MLSRGHERKTFEALRPLMTTLTLSRKQFSVTGGQDSSQRVNLSTATKLVE
ncbi:hypothetical protein WN55_10852 [Dufourea novaeangliae]|uniref:Uncharacterized protein n=1 Tax=Dufourea novaeangliae TaxID=178035 RepID=A0A154PAX7_DUFNO|nr:hypothetical protein WN55_10852 [Dufourea novaeangliae]